MNNYVQRGDVLTVTAPYDVASAAGCLVGGLFGITAFSAASGASVEIQRSGVFDMAKADSQAWTVGAKIYWDDTNKVATTTASTNTPIGYAALAVASSAGLVIGRVVLTPST